MNCWEFMKCGREPGGANAVEMGICPAYPDHGRDCARIAGTLCNGMVQGTHAQKLGNCTRCEFYQSGYYKRTSSASLLSSSSEDMFGL